MRSLKTPSFMLSH